MKKILTLALALIMALALAAPAMAFTKVAYEADPDTPVELAIKLVDVEPGYVSVNLTAAPSNRAYVRGEMVCAVVSMYVPKNTDASDGYSELVFSGKNVSVWQDENFRPETIRGGFFAPTGAGIPESRVTSAGGGAGMLNYLSRNAYDRFGPQNRPFYYADEMAADNQIYVPEGWLSVFDDIGSNQTYHFAFFGRILADGATMNAALKGAYELRNGRWNDVGDYEVLYWNTNKANETSRTLTWTDLVSDTEIDNYLWGALGAPDMTGAGDPWTATYPGDLPATDLVPDGKVGYYVKHDSAKADENDYIFLIITDSKFRCEAMYVFEPDSNRIEDVYPGFRDSLSRDVAFEVYSTTSRRSLVFDPTNPVAAAYMGALLLEDSTALDVDSVNNVPAGTGRAREIFLALRDRVNDIIIGEFGLDPSYKGGMLKPAWWVGNDELFVEVAIEPWYAEVTVPPEIEIEPPKTGDALNVMSFVLVALAGLAVVAIRKVRA